MTPTLHPNQVRILIYSLSNISIINISVSDPDSLNPDPDPANFVNPDQDPDLDPGLKKLFKNKVLKIEFKWTFLDKQILTRSILTLILCAV